LRWLWGNLKLRETLRHESIRDSLTGLYNRRYLEEFFDRELKRCQRNQDQIGLLMLDVDHFKRFNDTFGHEAGDLVLREISHILHGHIRQSEIACRYGGEECMVILPGSSLNDTQKRAEELRQQIKSLNLQHQGQVLGRITVSIGVACFPDHGKTYDELFRNADAALYRAKAQGRDRVVIARL
jgi:diguanylate cyclase (GGDEF)-like protein